jgi:hypothetical protein
MSAGPVGSVTSDSAPVETSLGEGIAGIVTTEAGEPVEGVFVQAFPLDPSAGPIPDIAIMTDAAGRFSWPLQPGNYRLTFMIDGETVAEAEAAVELNRVSGIEIHIDE